MLNKSVSVTREGIKNEEEGYEPTNTAYENAAPGVGAVLRKHEYLSLTMVIQCRGAFLKIHVGKGATLNTDICVTLRICVDLVCCTLIDLNILKQEVAALAVWGRGRSQFQRQLLNVVFSFSFHDSINKNSTKHSCN
jgi:hypothetical protein